MEINVATKCRSTRTVQNRFTTDNLFSFYDFGVGEMGGILISWEFIEDIKNKCLGDLTQLPIAEAVLDMAEKYPAYDDLGHNFVIYTNGGKIKIELGNNMFVLKDNLQEYRDYLDTLRQNGFETYIEFSI